MPTLLSDALATVSTVTGISASYVYFSLWQSLIYWAPASEIFLTASASNGCLLGWNISPLRQSTKLWLHDAGITGICELVGGAVGLPHSGASQNPV